MKSRKSKIPITKFLLQKGHNTVILEKNGQQVLVHVDQFRSRIESENVEMEQELGNEEQEEILVVKQSRVWKKMIMNR